MFTDVKFKFHFIIRYMRAWRDTDVHTKATVEYDCIQDLMKSGLIR